MKARKKRWSRMRSGLRKTKLARQEELARAYRVSERLLRENNLHHVWRATDAGGGAAAFGCGAARTTARAISLHSGGRISGHEYRAAGASLFIGGRPRGILSAVGDDDQAIYRFRGASFGSFTIFLERFCGVGDSKLAAGRNKHLVSLTQNYRSTQRILRVAGEVISANEKSPLLPPKG